MINKIPLTAIDQSLSEYASAPDAHNIYTVVDFRRANGTLYMRSTLKNPDGIGYYATAELQYYDALGTNPLQKVTWTFTYDSFGQIITKVVS